MPVRGAPLPKLSDPETGPLHPQTLACTSTVVSAVTGLTLLRGDDARPYENEHPDVTTGCGDVNFPEFPCPETRSEVKANIVNLLPYKGLPAGSLHAFFFFRPKEALEPGGPWPNGPWARIGLEALGYETFRPSCARVGDFGALRQAMQYRTFGL